ncbi:MAG: hypothetical protein WBH40_16625 [Ignavibacteriaceae bacterium]|jgi:hypothetical protein
MNVRLNISRFLCLALLTTSVYAQNAKTLHDPRLEQIYLSVQRIVISHYPTATSHLLKNKIQFEFNTRLFIIHVPLKTGEWQDPWEERGPRKGGILGTIELRDGEYTGAAMVPQTFDRLYYSIILLAPYSRKHDCYLYVHLYVPQHESKPEFNKELIELVNAFESKLKE